MADKAEANMEDTSLVSIREAAEELKIDRRMIRGLVMGMKIRLIPVGKSLVMSRTNFARLKTRIKEDRANNAVTI